jgi:hypothetical protein
MQRDPRYNIAFGFIEMIGITTLPSLGGPTGTHTGNQRVHKASSKQRKSIRQTKWMNMKKVSRSKCS